MWSACCLFISLRDSIVVFRTFIFNMRLRSGTSTGHGRNNANISPKSGEGDTVVTKSRKIKTVSKNRLKKSDTPLASHRSLDSSIKNEDRNGYLNHSSSINNIPGKTNDKTNQDEILVPHRESVVLCLKLGAWFLISMYFLIPAFIKLNPWIMAEMTFLHRLRWPPFLDLNDTAKLGLNNTYNFKLKTEEAHSLGVWHMLPQGIGEVHVSEKDHVASLGLGYPIIMYSHGQAGTRAAWHRVALYKKLTQTGFHVIAYDYRGYGDSDGSPSEEGLIEDSYTVLKWIKKHSGRSSVFLWGHSMGTGVTTQLAQILCKEDILPTAVILEAPFTNILEAAASYPLTIPFTFMPWYTWVFVESIQYNNISFSNDDSIRDITVPILVLHAKDDGMVSYRMGQKLYQIGKETRRNIQMFSFDSTRGYGHKHIHKAPELMSIVRNFTKGIIVHNTS